MRQGLFFAEEQVKVIEAAEQKEPIKVRPVILEIQPRLPTNSFIEKQSVALS